jgi:hypothetical protein
MTMRGVLGVFRVNVLEKVALTPARADKILPALLSGRWDGPRSGPYAGSVFAIGGGLTAFMSAETRFLDPGQPARRTVGIGLAVVAAWYVSGHLGYIAEHPETLEEAFIATNSGRMESLSIRRTAGLTRWNC